LQCVAVCCSVMQCVAMCCSVLQCVAVCCSVLQCDTPYSYVRRGLFMCVIWLIHMCDMTHSCMCKYTLQHTATHCNTLQHAATRCSIRESFMCVIWLRNICVTWLVHIYIYAWHGHFYIIYVVLHSTFDFTYYIWCCIL